MQEHFTLTAPSAYETRDFFGFRQFVETFEKLSQKSGKWELERQWVFYIKSFFTTVDGKEIANVLRSDGTYEPVPIDKRGRILIHGKYYNRRYWNH